MNEVRIVKCIEGVESFYEIRDERNTFIADSETLEEAVDEAMEFAKANDIEEVKLIVQEERF